MLRYTYTSILTRPFLSFFSPFLTFKCLFVFPGAVLNQKKKRQRKANRHSDVLDCKLKQLRRLISLWNREASPCFSSFSFSFFRFHSSCTSYETEKSTFVISSWPKLIWRRIKMTWWSVSLITMKGKNTKGKGAAGYRCLRASCESKGISSRKKKCFYYFFSSFAALIIPFRNAKTPPFASVSGTPKEAQSCLYVGGSCSAACSAAAACDTCGFLT